MMCDDACNLRSAHAVYNNFCQDCSMYSTIGPLLGSKFFCTMVQRSKIHIYENGSGYTFTYCLVPDEESLNNNCFKTTA